MKKFTIPCSFGNKKSPFDVYIGLPSEDWHPLYYQSLWLVENRGGKIPTEVMESFEKLLALAQKNGVSFEELCVYALEAANEQKKKIDLSSLSQQDQDLIAAKNLNISNETRIIATAFELKHAFDENFNLLFVICRDQSGIIYHSIMLVREDKSSILSKLVDEGKITLEQLHQYGQIEHVGKGPKLDPEASKTIREKYKSLQ